MTGTRSRARLALVSPIRPPRAPPLRGLATRKRSPARAKSNKHPAAACKNQRRGAEWPTRPADETRAPLVAGAARTRAERITVQGNHENTAHPWTICQQVALMLSNNSRGEQPPIQGRERALHGVPCEEQHAGQAA